VQQKKEKIVLKRVWAAVLAAVLSGGTVAQTQAVLTPEKGASAAPIPAPLPPPAFALKIEAPEEIQSLLTRHLELLRYQALSDLSDNELQRLMNSARQDTQDLLATEGYFSPEIQVKREADTSPTMRTVHLHVAPGDPTRISEVRILFTGPITTDPATLAQQRRIEAQWSLKNGARFTQAAWTTAKQQALLQLRRQRYPTGQVATALADIDPVGKTARLSITLDSGPAFQLGALAISGAKRYDTQLITRLTRLPLGVSYEQTQLDEAQQRLVDSGYFDSVFISLDTSADPQSAPVRVQLRESLLQKLVLGVGASTDSGVRLSVEHTHHQLPWIDWRAVSKLSLDRVNRSLGTELTAPPDESNWRWVTAGQVQSQIVGSFDVYSQRLRGGRSQYGPQIDRNYYLQYDRAQTAATATTQVVTADALSANFALTRRNFDNPTQPTSGWGLGAELGGGTTLGSQRDPYSRLLLRGMGYLPLGKNDDDDSPKTTASRLALRAQVGAVIARDNITLPASQLFLTGGDTSVRGYGLRDIGVTLPDGQITAGRYLAFGSVEWQRPITGIPRLADWEGTVFIDAGAVADTPRMLQAQVGVGIGARWKSPVGPLQIDLAYGVAAERLRLHLNVGFTF
jgi:translocation and assembly module TamA